MVSTLKIRRLQFMGFRCPVCSKDFGNNKNEWSKHIYNEHDGLGNDCVMCLRKIAGEINTEVCNGKHKTK
jgi:hypothetical protein